MYGAVLVYKSPSKLLLPDDSENKLSSVLVVVVVEAGDRGVSEASGRCDRVGEPGAEGCAVLPAVLGLEHFGVPPPSVRRPSFPLLPALSPESDHISSSGGGKVINSGG